MTTKNKAIWRMNGHITTFYISIILMNFSYPYLPRRDEAPKPTTALDYTFGRRAKTGHNIVSCLNRRKTFQLSSEQTSLGLLKPRGMSLTFSLLAIT